MYHEKTGEFLNGIDTGSRLCYIFTWKVLFASETERLETRAMHMPPKGIYRHFKGNRYELIDIARHSETMEWMVVYRALYGERGLWVRPLSMWEEIVERDGVKTPRFALETEDFSRENMEETMLSSADFGAPEDAISHEPIEKPAPEPESTDPRDALKRYFGYDSFRDGQEPVVNAILSGRDTLAVMPTGSGKSICYQVPALTKRGVAIVVSPLISLMKDQVQSLKQSGVPAAYLNSSLTERQMELAIANAAAGMYRILYVAPERLLTGRFLALARSIEISLVAVDEAHCISQWGQDFRPSYLSIPEFLNQLPKRPVVCAFTATATARVREDVRSILKLQNPFESVLGFDRKNLYLSVIEPQSKDAALMKLLTDYRGFSGIVYCATRKKVEEVAQKLIDNGVSATRYHAGLSDAERKQNQDDFAYDRREVMVATNAFGMGIDKSNVRFVIHYNMPKDPESYYQEIGRAGRDGERADCHLLFGKQDILTQKRFIERMGEEAGLSEGEKRTLQQGAYDRLNAMIRYCQTPECLRAKILRYFGESAPDHCGFCLNCLEPKETVDRTDAARQIVCAVEETGQRFGRTVLIEILRGAETQRTGNWNLARYDCFGALSNLTTNEISALIDAMLEARALEEEMRESGAGQYAILHTGAEADRVISGARRIQVFKRKPEAKKEKKKREAFPMSADQALFDRLSALRRKLANARGVPPYVVLHDSTLHEMADKMPSTMDEMAHIGGIGATKLRQYGKLFLNEIQKYESEKGGRA